MSLLRRLYYVRLLTEVLVSLICPHIILYYDWSCSPIFHSKLTLRSYVTTLLKALSIIWYFITNKESWCILSCSRGKLRNWLYWEVETIRYTIERILIILCDMITAKFELIIWVFRECSPCHWVIFNPKQVWLVHLSYFETLIPAVIQYMFNWIATLLLLLVNHIIHINCLF
jgi:hypothetical protein